MKVSTGEYLIRLLEAYDVDVVFGIPGVHTVELYRGLAESRITHVTPRHEQGAGFMADGYARMSGKPGVCLVITGPGLSNIATAMLQARADSKPMLVISGVNNPDRTTRGNLHEMPDQSAFARTVAVETFTASCVEDIATAIHSAFTLFSTARPGPVHIEIPLSLMQADCSAQSIPKSIQLPIPLQAAESEISEAQGVINKARTAIILAGGGTREASADVVALAERLNAIVITTANARTCIPAHPLVVHASASLKPLRQLIESVDVVIAIGTELGPTDYDVYETEGPLRIKCLIRIDIDELQLKVNQTPDIGLCCTARDGILALLNGLDSKHEKPLTDSIHQAIRGELSDDYRHLIGLLERLRNSVDNAIFVGDSTQLIYAGNLAFASGDKGAWFNSSVGFGTLGYGLSAAIGAKLACPDLPVICLMGDGGMQFTLSELGTLQELGLSMVIVVWNNQGYGEIREFMKAKDVKPEGVDLAAPDFCAIANAYGLSAERAASANELISIVEQSVSQSDARLIDVSINDQFEF